MFPLHFNKYKLFGSAKKQQNCLCLDQIPANLFYILYRSALSEQVFWYVNTFLNLVCHCESCR